MSTDVTNCSLLYEDWNTNHARLIGTLEVHMNHRIRIYRRNAFQKCFRCIRSSHTHTHESCWLISTLVYLLPEQVRHVCSILKSYYFHNICNLHSSSFGSEVAQSTFSRFVCGQLNICVINRFLKYLHPQRLTLVSVVMLFPVNAVIS